MNKGQRINIVFKTIWAIIIIISIYSISIGIDKAFGYQKYKELHILGWTYCIQWPKSNYIKYQSAREWNSQCNDTWLKSISKEKRYIRMFFLIGFGSPLIVFGHKTITDRMNYKKNSQQPVKKEPSIVD